MSWRPPILLPRSPHRWRWIHRWAVASTEEAHSLPAARWSAAHAHRHGHREIMVVLKGDHFFGVRGKIYRARPGSIFLFDRDELHDSAYSPRQPDCHVLWFHLLPPHQAVVNEIRYRRGQRRQASRAFRKRLVMAGSFVEAVLESWERCADGELPPTALAQLKAAVTALLLQTETCLLNPPPVSGNSVEQQRVVEHIQEHIRAYPGNDLSLGMLARLAGYAAGYFHLLFQRHTGMRLHPYVNRVRLDCAKKLLADGRSVESVAEELRFGTPAYFSRFFKNATGRSPVQWKRQVTRKLHS